MTSDYVLDPTIDVTVGFLDRCPVAVKRVFLYWIGKRGERRMPRPDEIDAREIAGVQPSLHRVEVRCDPLRFVYRDVGPLEIEARGYDPSGREVADSYFGSTPEHVLASYRYVVQFRAFLYDSETVPSPGGRLIEEGSLFLPLSEDDGAVSQILVYSHYRTLAGEAPAAGA